MHGVASHGILAFRGAHRTERREVRMVEAQFYCIQAEEQGAEASHIREKQKLVFGLL